MSNKSSDKSGGLFGRFRRDKIADATRQNVMKPGLTLLAVAAAASAELLRGGHTARSYTDVQIQNIARGLHDNLATIIAESARQDKLLTDKKSRQPFPLAMALATVSNFATLLDQALDRYADMLLHTNPQLVAIRADLSQSKMNALPEPGADHGERVVDADQVSGSAATMNSTVPSASVSNGNAAPSVVHMSERERAGLANDLRGLFQEIIGGGQYVQASIGEITNTNQIKLDTAISQARALVVGLREKEQQVKERYNIA
ncbi:MAG: hypothetical protein OJF49_000400 [Ktedonobacterales bacterium]|jgi:hypothetical protein|nr:MAG: hypothetical protein OJF49_000400 [Ktedonobacterales bacterium]